MFQQVDMLKKILISVAVVVVVAAGGIAVYWDSLMLIAFASTIKPDYDFTEARAPDPPDYDNVASWAALPFANDASDDLPDGVEASRNHPVDVFFLHPTSYAKKDNWNQPLNDEQANWIVDERILRHQASVFNSCCDVYAPRYRQATFFSFFDNSGDGTKALDLAYSDIERAFDHYIEVMSYDKPFILAGHSQGTAHATRLLREKIAGTPLQERLVAAYLVGFSVGEGDLGGVPVCQSATQTGCVVGWNSADAGAAGLFPGQDVLCVNPLTWNQDNDYAAHDLNEGGIGYASWGPVEGEDVGAMILEPGAADAECGDGSLFVRELRSTSFPSRMPGGSMHVYDYSLFHMNVRHNAETRVAAFLDKD
jgi:hypothetical protein